MCSGPMSGSLRSSICRSESSRSFLAGCVQGTAVSARRFPGCQPGQELLANQLCSDASLREDLAGGPGTRIGEPEQ